MYIYAFRVSRRQAVPQLTHTLYPLLDTPNLPLMSSYAIIGASRGIGVSALSSPSFASAGVLIGHPQLGWVRYLVSITIVTAVVSEH